MIHCVAVTFGISYISFVFCVLRATTSSQSHRRTAGGEQKHGGSLDVSAKSSSERLRCGVVSSEGKNQQCSVLGKAE